MTRQIAIFGGSFNPPTRAHAQIMQALAREDRYDEVWIMPSKDRADKTIGVSAEDRLEMIEALLGGELRRFTKLKVSTFELDLPGPTMTAQTLAMLSKRFPGDEFTMVIGEDSLATLPSWEDGEWLLEHARWLVVPRIEKGAIERRPRNMQRLNVSTTPVSSTLVRSAVGSGASINDYVHGSTNSLIQNKELYQ